MASTGVAKGILRKVFGLTPNTAEKIMKIILSSGDGQAVQTSNIRQRMGTQSFAMMQKAISAAKADSGSDDEGEDIQKEEPKEEKKEKVEKVEKKEEVKESFTLSAYLIQEATIDVDLSDPNAATQTVRNAARVAKASPDRLSRDQIRSARDKKKEAQTGEDSPTKRMRIQLAKKQEEVAMLSKRINDMEKRQG